MKSVAKVIVFCVSYLLCLYPNIGSCVEIGKVDMHGFLSQGYLLSSDNNYMAETEDGTFQFTEMGINLNYNLLRNLRVGGQLFAKDLGPFYDNEVEVDWVLLDYSIADWIGVRLGKLKAPLGFYNTIRDYDMLRVCTILPQSVYIELNRDSYSNLQGGEIYGRYDVEWLGLLDWQVMVGTQRIPSDSGTNVRIQENAPLTNTSFEFNSDVGKKVFKINFDNMFTLKGLTYQFVFMDVDEMVTEGTFIPTGEEVELDYNYFHAFTHSVKFCVGDILLQYEYLKRNFKYGIAAIGVNNVRKEFEGWYVGLEYQLFDQLALGTYWSELYNDTDDKSNPREYNKALAFSLRYDLSDYCILKGEAHRMEGVGGTTDELLGDPPDFEKDWWLYALKVSFMF